MRHPDTQTPPLSPPGQAATLSSQLTAQHAANVLRAGAKLAPDLAAPADAELAEKLEASNGQADWRLRAQNGVGGGDLIRETEKITKNWVAGLKQVSEG